METTKKTYTREQLRDMFSKLPAIKKIDTLWLALDLMQQYNGRTKYDCVFMAMGYDIDFNDESEMVYYKK
jgi:hypothetical protein